MKILMIPPLFRRKELEGSIYRYYWHPENIRYIKAQIIFAISDMEEENNSISGMLRADPKKLDYLDDMIRTQTVLEDYRLPLKMQLHNKNIDMIFRTAKQIHDEPALLDEKFDRIGDSGEPEYSEYGYSAYSFRGGQYHPADIFTESRANRKQAYWVPLEVKWNPWERGPGNHWTDEANPLPFNPYEVKRRFVAPVEPNHEDRRVQIPKKIPY
jgi:hypothetical protein